MRSDWRVRLLGALVALAALPAAFLVPEPAGGVLAAGLAVTGLFVAVVAAERAVPAPAAEALVRGGARGLEQVARGLKLSGRPVYVHDQGNVGEERLFLPASDARKPVPILDADTAAYAGAAGTMAGLAFAPPGLALVQRHEADTGAELARADISDVEQFLRSLGSTHDLARGLRVSAEGGRVDVSFAAGAVRPPCLDDPSQPLCERTGCALCQAVGCALARSLNRPVAVAGATVEAPRVTLRFDAGEELA